MEGREGLGTECAGNAFLEGWRKPDRFRLCKNGCISERKTCFSKNKLLCILSAVVGEAGEDPSSLRRFFAA